MNENNYKLMAVVLLCSTIAAGALTVYYNYKLGSLGDDYNKMLEELENFTVQVNIMIDYGDGNIESSFTPKPDVEGYDGKREKGSADITRVETSTLPLSERQDGFKEVDLCFEDEDAANEACRCLQCD